jgi:hypothetical protein
MQSRSIDSLLRIASCLQPQKRNPQQRGLNNPNSSAFRFNAGRRRVLILSQPLVRPMIREASRFETTPSERNAGTKFEVALPCQTRTKQRIIPFDHRKDRALQCLVNPRRNKIVTAALVRYLAAGNVATRW